MRAWKDFLDEYTTNTIASATTIDEAILRARQYLDDQPAFPDSRSIANPDAAECYLGQKLAEQRDKEICEMVDKLWEPERDLDRRVTWLDRWHTLFVFESSWCAGGTVYQTNQDSSDNILGCSEYGTIVGQEYLKQGDIVDGMRIIRVDEYAYGYRIYIVDDTSDIFYCGIPESNVIVKRSWDDVGGPEC